MNRERCYNCGGYDHKSIRCEFAATNYRCVKCGRTTEHRSECDSKWFDLGPRMPAHLTTKAETEEHNRREFERQREQHRAGATPRTRTPVDNRPAVAIQPPSRPISYASSIGHRLEIAPRATLTNSVSALTATETGSRPSNLSSGPMNQLATNDSVNTAWMTRALESAARLPSIPANINEPKIELTQQQLAALIDGGVQFAQFQQGMEKWYGQQRASGCFDVRLDEYSFRCAEYKRYLASEAESNDTTLAVYRSVPPPSGRVKAVIADNLVMRIRIADLDRVVLFGRDDSIDELMETPRDVGAGLEIVKKGECLDIIGTPIGMSTAVLQFCDKIELKLTITPRYVVVADRYLLTEKGVIELLSHECCAADWQVMLIDRAGAQRIGLRLKTKIFDIRMTEEGTIVTKRN